MKKNPEWLLFYKVDNALFKAFDIGIRVLN